GEGGVKVPKLKVPYGACVGALATVVLSACAKNAPQTSLEPQGPIARQIDNLINPVFIVAGIVFVLVQGLVVFAMVRYKDRGQPEPEQIHGSTRLEIAWTLVPALILLAIAIPTIKSIFDLSKAPSADALKVTVIGHQFWWEYQYEDSGVISANELVIPVGREVALTLKSVDVIHSYWIPALAGKTDVIPGRVNHMKVESEAPGEFPGQCTEFCGTSHANMRNRAISLSDSDFDKWVEGQKQKAATPSAGTLAADGMATFSSRGCGSCHTIDGVSEGKIGPSLTHLASRDTFAGAMFENNAENLTTWLTDPQAAKPGNKMIIPGAPLGPEEIEKLIAYLETLK
ncbi:MAG: cytochrome c oxidase subunit II, partial [Pseudonocardiaceae bacterium]